MSEIKIKFNNSNSEFYKILKLRVDEYFKNSNTSRFANRAMIIKSIVVLILFFGSYFMLISNYTNNKIFILLLTLLFGFSTALIAFNISHDAAHGAYSQNQKINKILAYSFNMIGVNAYIWNLKHNLSHHSYTNIPSSDLDIEQAKVARITLSAPIKKFHRYQHIYMPLVYMTYSLFLVFVKDFQMFGKKKLGNITIDKHPRKEYFILFFSKVFYITYGFVLPFVFIKLPWYQILFGIILMHLLVGMLLALIFVPVHALDDSPFPEVDANGKINNSWAVHQVEVTTNFAPDSKIINWFSGGLNTHIAHHLFPNICHIHYFELSKIIRQTAKEFNISHRDNTIPQAIKSHLRLLKKLGRE